MRVECKRRPGGLGTAHSRLLSLPAVIDRRFLLGLVALVLLALARYGWGVGISFINDDFLFLERARTASFLDNWNFNDAIGNVYRPIPRNVYFWAGYRVFGGNPTGYHLLNLGWVALSLVLTALVSRRLIADASGRPLATGYADGPALFAALLFALHPAAGTAAGWVCGIQDLLAVNFVLAALLAHFAGKRILYLFFYVAALLSKETSAFLFLLVAFWDIAVGRVGLRTALTRQAPAAALFAVWLAGNRWLPWNDLGRTIHSPVPGKPSLLGHHNLGTVLLTLRALFLVHPLESVDWPHGPVATAAQVVLAAWLLALAASNRIAGAQKGSLPAGLIVFALLWLLSGVLPLVALKDHFIYYAYYPALALSMVIATLAAPLLARVRTTRRPVTTLAALALPVIALLAGDCLVYHPALRDGHYLRRATAYLDNFRGDLLRMHPSFPESSRIYLSNIPSWIGFQLADGPAIRVWYDDPTLSGHFLSAYQPDPDRPAYFFMHDDSMHLVETIRGLPDPGLAHPSPIYATAHNDLGSTLTEAGEPDDALIEWRKALEVDPHFADAAANLGIVLVRMGRFSEAVPPLERAAELQPDAADVRLTLGRAYASLGAYNEAMAAFQAYLRLAPEGADRGSVEKAIEWLRSERDLRAPRPMRPHAGSS